MLQLIILILGAYCIPRLLYPVGVPQKPKESNSLFFGLRLLVYYLINLVAILLILWCLYEGLEISEMVQQTSDPESSAAERNTLSDLLREIE